ncbi:ATP-NAD kinase [Halorubrum sp. AD140]|uniref:ATP-NAD kinase n=1 Tax=Halorubrum sp. AD140 TaxID=3050073 RepID=UPI002ACCAF3E|nr:ATP-NAD kinase [Halorubrum sp. AD140]MDZ5811970.1 ATP-NAD kinase [Halorubrum sp. AD140]
MDPSDRRVAVVGEGDLAAALRDAVAALSYRVVDAVGTDAPSSADCRPGGDDPPDAIVPVGADSLRAVLVGAPNAPVIPVGSGRFAVDAAAAQRRLRDLLAEATRASDDPPVEGARRVTHPVLTVDAGPDSTARAVFDAALVTQEPARISEFAVGFPGRAEETFRADGVVVATPLGSDGYAAAAGAPVVEPGGGLSVSPIAPFSTRTDAWIAADRLRVTVEREAEPVSIVVDGAERGAVAPHRSIAIEAADRVALVVLGGANRARRSETL